MKIKFLKAGNGDSILLSVNVSEVARNILIDGGVEATYYSAESDYGELKTEIDNIKRRGEFIDLLILTHIDNDHICGLLKWFEMDKDACKLIKNVWFNSGKQIAKYLNQPENSDLAVGLKIFKNTNTGVNDAIDFEEFLLKNKLWDGKIVVQGQKHKTHGVDIHILSPDEAQLERLLKEYKKVTGDKAYTAGKEKDWGTNIKDFIVEESPESFNFVQDNSVKNGSSISFILTINRKNYLFLGDSHPKGIVKYLKGLGYDKDNRLDVELLKVAHHGSKSRLYQIGKNYSTSSLVICPPLVVSKWEEEFRALKKLNSSQLSMGLLSNAGGKNKKKVEESLEIAKILTVDEAHNYLSATSNRTRLIKNNQAEYKILVTATPISKRVEDLLRLIELLDLDNLSDEDFESYSELIKKPQLRNQEQHIQKLRKFISKFTVRRTKRALNAEIEKNQEQYLNKLNKTCKFPQQAEKTYTTKESQSDIEIVKKINELASGIKGVTYLTLFQKPAFEMTQDESIKGYVEKRINAARALSIYMIRAALRSSRVALVEHIEGTEAAMDLFKFKGKTKHTGHKLKTIQDIIDSSVLPKRAKLFRKEFFPVWLIDLEKFNEACRTDLSIYEEISKLGKQLSDKRELGKVEQLIQVSKKHNYVLAFDSTVITLYYLRHIFTQRYGDKKVLVATGNEKEKDSRKVMDIFNLTSESNEPAIALCSDKMSESIDLQRASCVMLLDLPSVLRVVEQRIGRADRMDSQHDKIEIYWPKDSEEFSLKADKRLVETNAWVDQIYGSNFNVPEDLKERHFESVDDLPGMIQEYKDFVDKDESWRGLTDSFQPIIELKEGENSLIDTKTYEEFRGVQATVKTKVSFIGGDKNWCFIALRGEKNRSPKWYFIDDQNTIYTEFSDVCHHLRTNIKKESKSLQWNDTALKKYVGYLKEQERYLLPPKKKRALEVAESILERNTKRQDLSDTMKALIQSHLDLLRTNTQFAVDFELLADEWISVLQPYLNEKRANLTRKRTVINLSSLKNDRKIIFSQDFLTELLDKAPITDNIDSKIASCIIGINQDINN